MIPIWVHKAEGKTIDYQFFLTNHEFFVQPIIILLECNPLVSIISLQSK